MATAAPAGAEESGPGVRWEAPDGCPLQDEFRALLGDDVQGTARARIVVAREPLGWTAWVVIGATVRELVGDSCYELADAAALVITLALRGIAQGDLADPIEFLPPAAPLASAPPLATGDAAVERLLARPAEAPATWTAGTGIGAEVGALPGTAAVVRVGVGVRGRHVAAGLEGAIATGEATTMRQEVPMTTRVRLLAAGARGCAGKSWMWLCAGVEAGAMSAVAEYGLRRGSGGAPWIAGRVGPSLVLPLADAWELVAQADVAMPLVYPRFTVGGVAVHDPGGATFRSILGVQRRFR